MPKQKSQAKTILIIILVVLVVGLALYLGWILYQQKQEVRDETNVEVKKPEVKVEKPEEEVVPEPEAADWKTYINEKGGYQIKIPHDWKIEEWKAPSPEEVPEGASIYESIARTTFLIPGYNKSEVCFLISVDCGVADETPSFFECKDFPGFKSLYCPLASGLLEMLPEISSESPSGFPGWTAYASLPCELNSDVYLSGDALRTYHFFILHKPGGYSQAEKTLKQILSTFKFIETDETADWQIYQSTKWSYQMKYPSNLYIKGDEIQKYPGEEGVQDLIISDIENMGVQDIMSEEKIHIDVYITPSEKKTLSQFVNEYKLGGETYNKEIITLGKDEAIKFVKKYESGEGTLYIFTKKDNFIYVIRGTNARNDDPLTDDNFKQMWKIMETFIFIETDETADWNIYFNPDVKITFRYPKDWEIRKECFYKGSENPTVVICRRGEPVNISTNCIQINMPQAPSGKREKVIQGNYINLYTDDIEIVEVYEKVVASFSVIK